MRELCQDSLSENIIPESRLIIYTDGSSHSNPGPAGAGVVITDAEGKIIREFSKYLGQMTNNGAEYSAFILGLKEALKLRARNIVIKVDSELVAKQLCGEYKVREESLRPFYNEAKQLMREFKEIEIAVVQRDKNKQADRLANKSINEAIKSRSDGYPPP